MEKSLKRKHLLKGVLWKSWPENFQCWQLMLNMSSAMDAFLEISWKFQNSFSKEHIWQDTSVEGYYNHCFIYITGNKNMTKPTFRLRGRPGKSTSCSHNKNAKIYGMINAQRGQLSDNNRQGFNSNWKITSFFSKKNVSTEPKCVDSAQYDVELVEMMSSTSDEPSVVQGNNLFQGNKEVDKTETNTNKENNKTEANTEEHGAGQEKQVSHIKENSSKFQMKVLTVQKEFTWFECRYGEGAYCSICKTVGLQLEWVRWVSKPHNLLKNDKAVSSCKHHENSASHKQNLNIIKMIKKWKRKGKGTVRTLITEGNRNKKWNRMLAELKGYKKVGKKCSFYDTKILGY